MADPQKTEQATEHRRTKAREEGTVARSRELPNVLAMGAVAATLSFLLPSAVPHWTRLYRELLDVASTEDLRPTSPIFFWSALEVMRWIAPLLLVALAVSVGAGYAQGGFVFAPNALQPKFDRFNPAKKLGQMFSPLGLSSIAKSLLPFGAIAWMTAAAFEKAWPQLITATDMSLRGFAAFVGSILMGLVWKAGGVLLAWSGVDYLLTWRKIEGDMKMSKQEVKEESKDIDGNPLIKRRLRQVARMMRRKWSMKAAATATVVITNPTHYAVALKYEQDMDAPIVVAKGLDLVAQKIKEVARDAGVMLIENRPLAQALYKTVEVGDTIPAKLYQGVAEILVLVYKAQAEVQRAEAARRSRDASGRPKSSQTAQNQPNPQQRQGTTR
jgi:flagellar biosynthetic protein FlhB